ncbi:MAG: sigma-54-dependent Fis family transcriptional regulator [Deltaproteobacteria bacterium]|nr:sigma-54-dependent Fis family transcriptional regulator [Deltaproteobacteria bacterium]
MENSDYSILVVDDEPNMRKVLSALLGGEGYDVETADSGAKALDMLRQDQFHAMITDLRMPGMDGLELLRKSRQFQPRLPVIMLTAHGTVDTAVEAIKQGAFDYLSKPFDKSEIVGVVDKALRSYEISQQDVVDPERKPADLPLIGEHPSMKEIFRMVDKVAASPSTVLISGESGTGKELIAQLIHDRSDRAKKPLIKLHCAAIPSTLLESELFGYEKGAFTGAVTSKPGRFELADGGTLFMDEVGDIPLEMQVKLLRVLQDQQFERVGGVKTSQVDVRLVAATHRDLNAAVREGRFREDLFYRLNVVPLHLPPLRERQSDIPLLADHFRRKFNTRLNRNVQSISPEAMEKLAAFSWPGNIRQLENVMERSMLFCEGTVLTGQDIPSLEGTVPLPPPGAASAAAPEAAAGRFKELTREASVRVQREIILKALEEHNHNVTRTAKALGLSRKGLQLKLKDLGLR